MSQEEQRIGASGRTYTVGALIARGGQGTVLGATRDDGLAVAIKVADESAVSRDALEREADLLQWLGERRVPGVAELLDRVDWDGRPAMVMPRYPSDANAAVAALIRRQRGTAVEAILALAVDLCRALGALHRTEIPLEGGGVGVLVHRDIKPENVLIDSAGSIRLVDLGGTLVVDAWQAVRLAVFGSPMWAPYDQVLPGLPEPNPTWDTYAAAVVLFAWISGTRPAYQADPTPMLTGRGREIWEALCALARAPQEDREALLAAHRALSEVREGTREGELVEVRGHAAIQPEDLEALRQGLSRLADPEIYGEEGLELCVRDLGLVFGRALSPLSHPSPPNRYWDALALAEELETARRRLVQAREARRATRERAGMEARLQDLGGRVLPATAVPIATDPTSEEEGLDPLPREVRAPRAPPATTRAGGGGTAGRWLLGVLAGLLIFAVLSIPLVYKLIGLFGDGAPPLSLPDAPLIDDGRREVEGGVFYVGDIWGEGEEDERPVRTVTLAGFRVDRTEVSNRAYRDCLEAGACAPLPWMEAGSEYDPTGGKKGAPFLSLRGEDQPAVGVRWTDAAAFCAWRGGRLPSEEEWEMAATWGPKAQAQADKRRWPWGEARPDCGRVNAGMCGRNTTLQVDSMKDGASAWGALHLAGNVWEWTSGTYVVRPERRTLFGKVKPAVEHRVLRGGAFDTPEAALRSTFRRHAAPDAVEPTYGFRCVYDG